MSLRCRSFLVCFLVAASGHGQSTTPPWMDPQVVSINQVAPMAALRDVAADESLDRISLNGDWRFLLVDRAVDVPADLAASLERDGRWSQIRVPGAWQAQGFGSEVLARRADQNPVYEPLDSANSAGIYVTDFDLPESWIGRSVLLRLHRVRSSVTVRVNGEEVGYSENADFGAAFEVTRFLRAGTNQIALTVTQWSTSSEHLGTHWTRAGLLGDVDLVARGTVVLEDVTVNTDYNPASRRARVDLEATLRAMGNQQQQATTVFVEAELLDADGAQVARRVRRSVQAARNRDTVTRLRFDFRSTRPWSSDDPYLYPLRLRLLRADGAELGSWRHAVGVRRVSFDQSGLSVNGRNELIHGVTLDADIAFSAPTPAAIEAHLALLKQAGINAVRLPAALSPEWHQRFDAFGIYVFPQLRRALSTAFGASQIERAISMMEETRNYTSTLVWVDPLATAPLVSGDDSVRRFATTHDSTRPFLPNRSAGLLQNPRSRLLERRVRSVTHSLLLWPFGSLLGNSGAGLQEHWQIAERNPVVAGGFLPHWQTATNSQQTEFIDRGLINPRGQARPSYDSIAELFRRFRFEATDIGAGSFRLVNNSAGMELGETYGRWILRQDGSVVAAGRLPSLGGGPGATVPITVAQAIRTAGGDPSHLTLELYQSRPRPGLPRGTLLARDQFVLRSPIVNASSDEAGEAFELSVSGELGPQLSTRDLEVQIDPVSGLVNSVSFRNRVLVDGPIRPSLWRQPTMLERSNGLAAVDAVFRDLFQGLPADWVGRRVSAASYSAVSEYAAIDPGLMRLQSTVHGKGIIELSLHWLGDPTGPDPPRVGVNIPLAGRFDAIEWLGRGPGENYIDRAVGEVARHRLRSIRERPYVWDQEHGRRSDVQWVAVRGISNYGLLVVSAPNASFSIAPRGEGGSMLQVDAAHRGVGGERDDAVPARRFRVPPGEYRATFLLVPIVASDDPATLASTAAPNEGVAEKLSTPLRKARWRLEHLGRGRPLNILASEDDPPPTLRSTLNDGWLGTVDALDGNWLTIDSFPAEITIDLEEVEPIHRVRLGFLESSSLCAAVPELAFSHSTDRRRWIGHESIATDETATDGRRKWINQDLLGQPARWLRVRLEEPQISCPDGVTSRVLLDEWLIE